MTTTNTLPATHTIYVGGPRTGKSTRIDEIAKVAEAAGWEVSYDVEAVHASLRGQPMKYGLARPHADRQVLLVLDGEEPRPHHLHTLMISDLMRDGAAAGVRIVMALNDAWLHGMPEDWWTHADIVTTHRQETA